MAKGNDGNYLQHSIEVAIATQLVQLHQEAHLHVALAHGMAPFEQCDGPKGGRSRRLLKHALNASYRDPQLGESPIVSAYRATKASFICYPDSAELLRKTARHLSGGITEFERQRYELLSSAWEGSKVVVRHASWRSQVGSRGVLACPSDLGSPWLLSLDPMTYVEDGQADDHHLHRNDLTNLGIALRGYIASGQPGAATILVYAVERDVRSHFWKFVDDVAHSTDVSVVSAWVGHYRDKRNVAAILSVGMEPNQAFLPGVTFGR